MTRNRGADVREAEAGCQSTSREEWGAGKFRGRGPGELRYQQLGGQGKSGSTMNLRASGSERKQKRLQVP